GGGNLLPVDPVTARRRRQAVESRLQRGRRRCFERGCIALVERLGQPTFVVPVPVQVDAPRVAYQRRRLGAVAAYGRGVEPRDETVRGFVGPEPGPGLLDELLRR